MGLLHVLPALWRCTPFFRGVHLPTNPTAFPLFFPAAQVDNGLVGDPVERAAVEATGWACKQVRWAGLKQPRAPPGLGARGLAEPIAVRDRWPNSAPLPRHPGVLPTNPFLGCAVQDTITCQQEGQKEVNKVWGRGQLLDRFCRASSSRHRRLTPSTCPLVGRGSCAASASPPLLTCVASQACTRPRPQLPAQIMHRFHFSSVLKRMSTIVEAEGDQGTRCACLQGCLPAIAACSCLQ